MAYRAMTVEPLWHPAEHTHGGRVPDAYAINPLSRLPGVMPQLSAGASRHRQVPPGTGQGGDRDDRTDAHRRG
jgi:hypothetical protein